MKTKKMAISAMFIAVGVLAGNIIYIPVGASKCFPVQHTLNILAAVFLGPAYGVINAETKDGVTTVTKAAKAEK